MYKKILVPISADDHSRKSLAALDQAMKICDGEIILLHVTDPIPQVVGGAQREELIHQNESDGMNVLFPAIEVLQARNAAFHTRVASGTVAETIVQIADEEEVELIVMYTNNRDELKDILLGTITERVLRNTDRDLLVVRV